MLATSAAWGGCREHTTRMLNDQRSLAQAGMAVLPDPPATEPMLDRYAVVLQGPVGTPYEGGQWRVRFTITTEYPFKSPSVGFVDPILHPNVDLRSGTVCVDALNDAWQPSITIPSIVDVVLPALLSMPNPHDPLNAAAAIEIPSPPKATDSAARRRRKEAAALKWDAMAREHSRMHAWRHVARQDAPSGGGLPAPPAAAAASLPAAAAAEEAEEAMTAPPAPPVPPAPSARTDEPRRSGRRRRAP